MPLIPAQDPIQRALAQHQAQQEMQQQLQQILQSTIQNPHTSERVAVSLCVLAQEGPNHVLLVASPDGRRRDIVLSQQAVQALARAAGDSEPVSDADLRGDAQALVDLYFGGQAAEKLLDSGFVREHEALQALRDALGATTDTAQDETQAQSGLAT